MFLVEILYYSKQPENLTVYKDKDILFEELMSNYISKFHNGQKGESFCSY